MKNQTESDSRDLLRLTAQLYYIDGLDEHQVAKIVGVSRSTVSRILARAREQGVVRFSVDAYNPRNLALEAKLVEHMHLRRALVVKTVAARSAADVRRTLGYFTAPLFSEYVKPQTIVGVAGGRSIADLVQALARRKEPLGINVVQLMGNIGADVSAGDAIEISRVLAQRLGGTVYTINAPAIASDRASRDVFVNHEHVQSVWQLFDRMQTALVGIGTLSDSIFIERGVLNKADLQKLADLGAVGEICGRFFNAAGDECHSDYRQRVISISLDVLRQVNEVVAVTTGAERAHALLAALRGRLVNSLIIDDRGARALLALVGMAVAHEQE